MKATPLYLRELIEEKKHMGLLGGGILLNAERLLDKEISVVREKVCNVSSALGETLELPPAEGEMISITNKVYIPVSENPDYNFVGRLLGPRGMTIKQLEQDLQCKIMVRGKGSLRNREKEEENRKKPNWEHLNDELHVLLQVEDTKTRAEIKLQRAKSTIEKFLKQALLIPDGEDEIKKRQLMELAIINGTYRDTANGKKLITGSSISLPPSSAIIQKGAATIHTTSVNNNSILNNMTSAPPSAARLILPPHPTLWNLEKDRHPLVSAASLSPFNVASCLHPVVSNPTNFLRPFSPLITATHNRGFVPPSHTILDPSAATAVILGVAAPHNAMQSYLPTTSLYATSTTMDTMLHQQLLAATMNTNPSIFTQSAIPIHDDKNYDMSNNVFHSNHSHSIAVQSSTTNNFFQSSIADAAGSTNDSPQAQLLKSACIRNNLSNNIRHHPYYRVE